jgi:DNA-binding MarR family transcriptional regulator
MDCLEDAERISPAIERLLMALLHRRFGSDMEPSPLSFTQQIALSHIADDGPLRLRALARRIGTTAATATRTTDALEAVGLVERSPDPTDGRGVLISPTQLGREARRESHRMLVVLLDRLLRRLERDERKQFVALMIDLHELVEHTERPRTEGRTAVQIELAPRQAATT